MIDKNEIQDTIQSLENGDTVWDTMQKLAMLYTVREHFGNEERQEERPQEPTASYASARNESEFLQACEGVNIDDLLHILDEHMEAIKLLYNREYQALIRKIKALK